MLFTPAWGKMDFITWKLFIVCKVLHIVFVKNQSTVAAFSEHPNFQISSNDNFDM